MATLPALSAEYDAAVVSPSPLAEAVQAFPHARDIAHLEQLLNASGAVDLARWEPSYGRLAEAQVKWEAAHGRALSTG